MEAWLNPNIDQKTELRKKTTSDFEKNFLRLMNTFVFGKSMMLQSDFCDYSDGSIVLKGTIDLLAAAANENDKAQKDVLKIRLQ